MFLNLEDYMLPCLNKKLFGVDCLGCGFQRAIIFILKGEFVEAFKIYPAIYTLLILIVFALLNLKFQFKHARKIVLFLAIINILIIIISYFIKIT
ncbi:MAG: DUF2752 domain-containing protein [Polaribacter sp.]|nr:DUF2752 domain-containing protein [Polaribacter sp.]